MSPRGVLGDIQREIYVTIVDMGSRRGGVAALLRSQKRYLDLRRQALFSSMVAILIYVASSMVTVFLYQL